MQLYHLPQKEAKPWSGHSPRHEFELAKPFESLLGAFSVNSTNFSE
jgi:hypothetical protein